MKPALTGLLLSTAALSLPALAQDSQGGFDNFILSSPSIISPSQYYQVKGGRFEAQAGMFSGEVKSKGTTPERSADVSASGFAVGYAHALNPQLVLAADVGYTATENEEAGNTTKDSDTEISPKVAFSLIPQLTLGLSANINSGEDDLGTKKESYNYTTFTVGATFHDGPLEGTLALTTKNENDKKESENSPQELALHGRYRILPVLTVGATYSQTDHPGVDPEGADPESEVESSYGLIVESAFNEQSRVEVGFQSLSNINGYKDLKGTEIFLSGGFKLNPNLELGAQALFHSQDSDTSEGSANRYSLTVAYYN